MTTDFRAKQIQTNRLIASGGISGTTVGLAVYSGSIASDNEGGHTSDSTMFSGLASDVYFFVSGSADKNRGTDDAYVTVFGGDVVVSGTLYADTMVVEVEDLVTGSLYVSASLNVREGTIINIAQGTSAVHDFKANSGLKSPAIHLDASAETFTVDQNSYFGSSGTGADVTFYGEDASAIGLQWDADYSEHGGLLLGQSNHGVDFIAYGETASRYLYWDQSSDKFSIYGALNHNYGNVIFNELGGDYDFRVESDNRQGAILVDAADDQVIISSNAATANALGISADTGTYISGAIGSKDVEVGDKAKGVTLIQGDTVVSGTFYPGGYSDQFISADGTEMIIDGNDNVDIRMDTEFGVYYSSAGNVNPIFRINSAGTIVNDGGLSYQDFRVESDTRAGAILVDAGANQVILSSNVLAASSLSLGDDVGTYISGAIGSHGVTVGDKAKGVTVLDGDTVVSGALVVNPEKSNVEHIISTNRGNTLSVGTSGVVINEDSSFYVDFRVETNSVTNAIFADSNENTVAFNNVNAEALVIGAAGCVFNDDANASNDFRVESSNRITALFVDASSDKVIISSNTAAGVSDDTGTYISGAIGSKGVEVGDKAKGTAVIGGDALVSGSLYAETAAHFGIDGTGADVTFYGDTAGVTMKWDADWAENGGLILGSNGASDGVDFIAYTQAANYYLWMDASAYQLTSNLKTVINDAGATFNDFRVESDVKQSAILVDAGTNQLAILSNGTTAADCYGIGAAASPLPDDVGIFLSGSVGGIGDSAGHGSKGTLLVGGDMYVSGNVAIDSKTLYMNGAGGDVFLKAPTGGYLTIDGDDNIYLYADTNVVTKTGGFVHNEDAGDYDFRVESQSRAGSILVDAASNQVIVGSSATTAAALSLGDDVGVFVSGAIGSHGVTVGDKAKGTSVFGGDVYVSGTLYVDATSGIVGGSGASTRLAYWSDTSTLTSDADLIFDGDTLTAACSSNTAIPAIKIDRNYTGTTAIGNYVTDPQGLLIDYDVTGIVASGQTAVHDALAINYNQDSPTMVGTIEATGADIRMTGGTSGVQSMKGVAITLTGADTNTGIDITVPNDGTHIIARSPDNILDQFKISVGAAGATTISTNDNDASLGNLTLDADGKIIIDAVAGDETVFNEGAADVDFRVESVNNVNMFIVRGDTDRVGIGTVASPQTTLHIKESSPTVRIQRSNNAYSSTIEFAGSAGAIGAVMHMSSSNDIVFKTHDGSSEEEILRLGSYYGTSNRQVILLSGSDMATAAMQPKQSTDINFFVSGSIGSRGTSTKGTSVFGGDVVASGSLTIISTDNLLSSSLNINKIFSSTEDMTITPADHFPKGMKIDYDVTAGPDGASEWAWHNALQIDYNQDSASLNSTAFLYGTGLSINMTAGTTGGQVVTGIDVTVTGSTDSGGLNDGNFGIKITAPPSHTDGVPLSVRNMSHIRCYSDVNESDYFDISVGNNGLTTLFTLDSDHESAAHINIVPEGKFLIHSGGAATSPKGLGTDTNFFVSGTIGSRGTAAEGTSVFGGDAVVSGSLYTDKAAYFGVNGTGADATFYGETSGVSMLWDSDYAENGALVLGATGGSKGVDFIAWSAASGYYIHWDSSNTKFTANSYVTFNELGAALDFRCESLSKQSALLVDGGTDQIALLTDGTTAANASKSGGAIPSDVGLYVSSSWTVALDPTNSAQEGRAFIDGDLVVSGNLSVHSLGYDQVRFGAVAATNLFPTDRLVVCQGRGSTYAATFFNDGDNNNRYGIRIRAGKDDDSGTNYHAVFQDGDGTTVGTISSTGGTVSYNPFTGAHHVQLLGYSEESYRYGEIVKVVSTSSPREKVVSYVCTKTDSSNDKAVIGVYSSALIDNPSGEEDIHSIFSLGDGHILVCDEGGNIEIGDYLCSSNTVAHGMKQSDDILRNYTVAKANGSVDWSTVSADSDLGFKWKLIPCTYHCG